MHLAFGPFECAALDQACVHPSSPAHGGIHSAGLPFLIRHLLVAMVMCKFSDPSLNVDHMKGISQDQLEELFEAQFGDKPVEAPANALQQCSSNVDSPSQQPSCTAPCRPDVQAELRSDGLLHRPDYGSSHIVHTRVVPVQSLMLVIILA